MEAEKKEKKPNELKNLLEVKKPRPFAYYTLGLLSLMLAKIIFRIKYDITELKKLNNRPFLLLANHGCVFDFLISGGGMIPKRINYLAARNLFSVPILKKLMDVSGAIPKKQFMLDLQALKLMKEGADKGLNLALLPEGKMSMDGTTGYISPSTAKLIKFLGIPIIAVKISGGYCSKPKWGKGLRRGRIEAKFSLILEEEQIKSLSNPEIMEIVKSAISFNDPEWQVENHIRFKCKKRAKNLEYALFKCPKCGEEYEMESGNTFLLCKACGNKFELSEYGELIGDEGSVGFPRIDLWYAYQREEMKKLIENPDFLIEKEVDFYINDAEKREFIKVGEGVLGLNSERLYFDGDLNGEPYALQFPTLKLPTLAVRVSEAIDLADENNICRFKFKEHKYTTKYNILVEEIFKRKNGLC